jgi:uncharacterized protein (DUF1778 family)
VLARMTDDALCGAKSVRMEQRTTEKVKSLIEEAAHLLGVNASEFTTVAAAKAARATLQEYHMTVVASQDHAAFSRALDAVEPTNDLVNLMRMHADVSERK